jgi:uncharacterized membrane protein
MTTSHHAFARRRRWRPGHRQPAQALALTALLLGLVLLPLVGLAIDAEILFSAHRRLEMLADGAARVGAMQLDLAASYARQRATLDPMRAEVAAEAYLQQTAGITGMAQADVDHIEVRTERDVELGFGHFWGRGQQHVVATAVAVPCEGIAQAEDPC